MTIKTSDILVGLIFIGLIFMSGLTQTELKRDPQIIMFSFGLLTLASFFVKQNVISTTLFFILLSTLLYVTYFMLTYWIIDVISPNRNIVYFNGEEKNVMDSSWMLGVLIGLLAAPLTVFLYQRLKLRNRVIEIITTAAYTLTTGLIYINFEQF